MKNSCRAEGCERPREYKAAGVCKKHYFRLRRNGTLESKRTRQYQQEKPAGYLRLFEPNHPLSAASDGYVYAHRFVYYNEVNSNPTECSICGAGICWDSLHIDHVDCDVQNNDHKNLRALCRACNVFRGHGSDSMGIHIIEVDGKRMSANAWARQPGVRVCGATIARRKKRGMSDREAVYGEKITHKKSSSRTYEKKYDRVRGISAHPRKVKRQSQEAA